MTWACVSQVPAGKDQEGLIISGRGPAQAGARSVAKG
jgi:hypothetical protein